MNLHDHTFAEDRAQPCRGTGRDILPTLGKVDALLGILRRVTGIQWEWYWGDKKLLGVEGTWQLMLLNSKDEGDFWWWHLEHSRQWFDSKHEATTALLTSWFSYMSNASGEGGEV
jgi:hypothetical protein